jgi:PKHD-type hydroxylase
MLFPIAPRGGPMAPFATWQGLFRPDEIDLFESWAAKAQHGTEVGDATGSAPNAEVRRSRIEWLWPTGNEDVFRRLGEVALQINRERWGLDVTGFGEAMQVTRYSAPDDGYGWHQDYGAVVSRKLSFVLQLTDPEAYDGGYLEIMTSDAPTAVPRERGLLAVFPSWQLHRVTPVTRGARHTLVAWMSGPPLR